MTEAQVTTQRGQRAEEGVTLGEVYRLVLSAITTLDHIGARLDNLDQRYLRADLYELQRHSDQQAVQGIKDDLSSTSSSRARFVSTVLVPSLIAVVSTSMTLILFLAERH